ncbi:MAG: alpha/beta hydrolase [Gemmatimonadota bacterium]
MPRAAKPIFQAIQAAHHGVAAAVLERLFLTPARPTLPREEQAFLESGRHERVDSPVGTLATWVWGEGRTVLLVHGWGSRASRYRTLVPALVAAGLRAVAMESPGHGISGGKRSSLPETARAVRFMAGRERERRGAWPWAVVGHSFGSAASILAQSDGVRFERNVFLAPSVDFDNYMARVASALGVKQTVARRMIARIERRLGFSWDALRSTELVPWFSAPALIFHDPADSEVPFQDAEGLAAAWPGAVLISTPGLGHRRLLHDPSVIERIVRFLETSSAASGNALTSPAVPSVSIRVQPITHGWNRPVVLPQLYE